MLSAPATVCVNHRKRERVASCSACESSLCLDCVVHTAVGIKCRRCGEDHTADGGRGGRRAAAKRPNAGLSLRPTASGSGSGSDRSGGSSRRRWAIPAVLAGAALIGVGAFGVLGGGGGSTTKEPTVDLALGGVPVERTTEIKGTGGFVLGATLTVPSGIGDRTVPGVVIVPGGAVLDRNNLATPIVGQNDPLFQDLAHALARSGVASIRYDPRGTGTSTLPQGADYGLDDLMGDAKGGIDFLADRKETAGAPLALVAYDHGGFVAMRLAASDPRVKAVALISMPGQPLVDILAADFLKEVPDRERAQALSQDVRTVTNQLLQTGTVPRPENLPPELRSVFPASRINYLKGLFSFDPVAEAAKVTVPVVMLRGGLDTSVTETDTDRLEQAFPLSETMVSPAGLHSLALPRDATGALHDPTRHENTRDAPTVARLGEWLKARLAVA